MPLNECPYIPLATEDVMYARSMGEISAARIFHPSRLVVGELEHAVYGIILCDTGRVGGHRSPILQDVIDESLRFSCDEGEKSVTLKFRGRTYGDEYIIVRFSDPLDFFELVRLLVESKCHLAARRSVHDHRMNILYGDQFLSPPFARSPASSSAAAEDSERTASPAPTVVAIETAEPGAMVHGVHEAVEETNNYEGNVLIRLRGDLAL
ncbi:hypothetical protein ONZ51_g10281 [Trametes cubensis]|uniref:Uncharacterized protein n=1 Tax=Trametes cubensis TaxID=1111947 RepID=A0AAD7X6K1_9APHY|nr:hypothetical protein ONZ51_g10281 [Trametes cubensis]